MHGGRTSLDYLRGKRRLPVWLSLLVAIATAVGISMVLATKAEAPAAPSLSGSEQQEPAGPPASEP